jgi:hypothetical protein
VTFWSLVQIFINLTLLTAVGFMWVRLSRPVKDDPRLSRGLQLLQSKISVLEDLSDRTEVQVTQLTTLMEQKCRDIQATIHLAEKQVQKIESSMGKSLEVAKIFQDKIPHQEIIERQNTIKYVKAARMAHQGVAINEIASQVDLSRGEIEFIAKVNREQLQFSEEDLPEWAKEEAMAQEIHSANDLLMEPIFQKPIPSPITAAPTKVDQTLSHLGDKFRQAFDSNVPQSFVGNFAEPAASVLNNISTASSSQDSTQAQPSALMKRVNAAKKNTQAQEEQQQPRALNTGDVRKVVFPKIEVNNNLG